MHVRQTVEWAGWLVAHRHAILASHGGITFPGLNQYWSSSKSRLDRWNLAIKQHTDGLRQCSQWETASRWQSFDPVFEEILTGDVLMCVWTAICSAAEQHCPTQEATPVARNIFVHHRQIRSRVLRMAIDWGGRPVEEAVRINRLRRRNERWTDLLLSYCTDLGGLEAFAFQRSRFWDFTELAAGRDSTVASILSASLRAAYQQGISSVAANPSLNEQIVSGILGCLPAEEFDGTGLLRSAWMQRLSRAAHDSQGMIDELLQLEAGGCDRVPTDERQPPGFDRR